MRERTNRLKLPRDVVVFSGGFSWFHLFKDQIDLPFAHELFNVAQLDDGDKMTVTAFMTQLEKNVFKLLIGHIAGVDHAGHYYMNMGHPELERKVLDAEKIVQETIDKMDNETILIAFGDHGMND
jgi:GPI ethanolamine phosphate transferase 3 subunit O